jgi:hypothetical protein
MEKISKDKIKKLSEAFSEFQKVFNEITGQKETKEAWVNYEDLKTFDDCCRQLGTAERDFDIKWNKLEVEADTIAYEKLKIVVRAINPEGWCPNWDDDNQKWWPYFNLSSGFGFWASTYFCDRTHSPVGSRLCFSSRERADYAGTQFVDIYKQFLK